MASALEHVFAGLNAEQRRAVEQVEGPVVILAGAGAGKTTTITRRIAHQVLSGTYAPTELLAVTFTTKAAGELKQRLGALGVAGVPASTFHAAAARQLRYFTGESRRVQSNKLPLIFPLLRSLPQHYRQTSAVDLAAEIEWARNRRLSPERYLDELDGHAPPIDPEPMAKLYAAYERTKAEQGLIDHEDQLELCLQAFEQRPEVGEEFRARYRAFTVDEFQDVNLLQTSS